MKAATEAITDLYLFYVCDEWFRTKLLHLFPMCFRSIGVVSALFPDKNSIPPVYPEAIIYNKLCCIITSIDSINRMQLTSIVAIHKNTVFFQQEQLDKSRT